MDAESRRGQTEVISVQLKKGSQSGSEAVDPNNVNLAWMLEQEFSVRGGW